jgi:WD40 repeat protein
LCEHAAAGASLNADVLPPQLLPFIDINQFREQAAEAPKAMPPRPGTAETSPPARPASWSALLALVRRVSHVWDWDHPYRNAAALQFWAAADQVPLPELDEISSWRVLWAKSPGPSEIIGRPASVITCLAADTLPAGDGVAVTGSKDGTLGIWNLETGTVITAPTRGGAMKSVAIVHRPGELPYAVSGSANGTLRLWEGLGGRSREPVRLAERLGGAGVTAMATASWDDYSVVLLGRQDGSLRIWDLDRDSLGGWSAGDGDPVTGIATAKLSDGRLVAVTVRIDGTLQLWDLARGAAAPRQVTRPLRGHDQAVRAVATATLPYGTTVAVTGSDDGSVRLWDLETPGLIGDPLVAHQGEAVTAVATCTVLGKAFALTAGRDHRLQAWTLPEGALAGEPMVGHSLEITALAAVSLPGDRAVAVSAGADHSLRVWDLGPVLAREPRPAAGGSAAAAGVRLPPGPAVASAGSWGNLQIWNLSDGRQLGEGLQPDLRNVTAVAAGTWPDGRGIVVTRCGQPGAGLVPERRDAGRTSPTAICLLDEEEVVVTSDSEGALWFWDLAEGRLLRAPVPGHAGGITTLATTRMDGETILVSGGTDRTLRIWDMTELLTARNTPAARAQRPLRGQPLLRDDGSHSHDGPVAAMAVSAWNGGHFAVSGCNTTVQVWDLVGHQAFGAPIELLTHPVTAIAAADVNGQFLGVVGSEEDGAVQVWDLAEGESLGILPGHRQPVRAIAIVAIVDGPTVAFTASSDHTVRAWNIGEGRPIGDAMPLSGIPKTLSGFGHLASPGLIVGGDDVLAALQLLRT